MMSKSDAHFSIFTLHYTSAVSVWYFLSAVSVLALNFKVHARKMPTKRTNSRKPLRHFDVGPQRHIKQQLTQIIKQHVSLLPSQSSGLQFGLVTHSKANGVRSIQVNCEVSL